MPDARLDDDAPEGSAIAANDDTELLSVVRWARELTRDGLHDRAEAELLRSSGAMASIGLYGEAIEVLAELTRMRPRDPEVHQIQVEYAVRLGETRRIIAAFLALGTCLRRIGRRARAVAVYRQILEIEPENEAALEGLRRAKGKPGTLLAGDELETRFVTPSRRTGDEAKDFAEVLAVFRDQLARHVPMEDAASHFDLGLGFREMGLLDEAIVEFQTALRGGADPLKVHEELGYCFFLKQQYDIAEKILLRALELPHARDASLVAVWYNLGRCYEELGQEADAVTAFQRVVEVDEYFRDASDRLARLTT